METVNLEQLDAWGFFYEQDGDESGYIRILGEDYINDPFLYAEKVRMGKWLVFNGQTKQSMSVSEVEQIINSL